MNVVLVGPEIPWNTGNVGRTCVAAGAVLHLVGKLGFSLKDKYLKRAGLDYWRHLDLRVHADWDAFAASAPADAPFFFLEKDAPRDFWEARFEPHSYLIFGSETRGFPERLSRDYGERFYKIPQFGPVRSLNLSTAAAVALYEALRQTRSSNLAARSV